MNLDIYKYQLSEIDNAKIKEGEEEELSSKLKIFYSAEKICSALKQIKNVLSDGYDGMSVNEQLNIANSTLLSLSGYNSKYIEWQRRSITNNHLTKRKKHYGF